MSQRNISRHLIWLIGVSFVLFQFFLQLSSGVVIGTIMHEMQLSALTAGLLSGTFYIIYSALQIPAGILFDRKSTRRLLTVNTLICSGGCFLFAASYSLTGLFFGRFLIGAGSSFAFIGLSHLLRQHYPLRRFAFMIGLSETLGFFATVLGIITMGALVAQLGWRSFINAAGVAGLFISYMCWRYIPEDKPKPSVGNPFKHTLMILQNKLAWINGIFVGLCFTVITAFGALWAIPFVQIKLDCDLQRASLIGSMFFVGTAIGCPLFGGLSAHFQRRKPLILSSCLSTAALLLLLLYIPTQNHFLTGLFLFMIGLCCGAYMLAYTIANELAPEGSQSTSTGFTNMLAVITTPLLQPMIGYFLDCSNSSGTYATIDYERALLAVPISLLIASVLVCFLPEKKLEK